MRPFLLDETSKRTRFGAEVVEALDELQELAVDAARGEPLDEEARCRPTADCRPPLPRMLVEAVIGREGPAKSWSTKNISCSCIKSETLYIPSVQYYNTRCRLKARYSIYQVVVPLYPVAPPLCDLFGSRAPRRLRLPPRRPRRSRTKRPRLLRSLPDRPHHRPKKFKTILIRIKLYIQ